VTTELLAVLVTTVAAVLAATVTIIGVVVSGQRSVRSEVRAIGDRLSAQAIVEWTRGSSRATRAL
jgi:hypothetical protein